MSEKTFTVVEQEFTERKDVTKQYTLGELREIFNRGELVWELLDEIEYWENGYNELLEVVAGFEARVEELEKKKFYTGKQIFKHYDVPTGEVG